MIRRAPKLDVNEKDKIAANWAADDPRRHWVAGKAKDFRRNEHPGVTANQQDHGFEHLHLEVSGFTVNIRDPPIEPPLFTNFNSEGIAAWHKSMRLKLILARAYVVKEKELGLDTDRRNAHKEKTALMLAEPPIKISLQAQNLVRLLLEDAEELHRLFEEGSEGVVDEEKMQEYWVL
jgi:hypothetical protein